jgi:hypothetical protein
MNTPELVEWHRVSSETGLVECWWTHPFLDVLNTWDLKDKTWLEMGCGWGTATLRHKCKFVDSVESNSKWAMDVDLYCKSNGLFNGMLHIRELADGIPELKDKYLEMIPDKQFDYISIDGLYRVECIEWAIDHFKGRGGIIVIDNLNQDYVFISPKAMELIAPYEEHVFIQSEHTNHEGLPWNTRYIKIPA